MEKKSLTERYTIRDVTSTLHVSRTTLLYYEEQGIVTPVHDEETGYRYYSDADLFRLLSCKLLKNIGVPIKDLSARLDNDPFSSQNFSDYSEILEERIEYCRAQKECLARLMALPDLVGTVQAMDVEPHYIDFDAAESGYSRFARDVSLDSLIEAMPIGALGCVFLSGRDDGWRPERRGRTVPVRFAHLIQGLSDNLSVIGGNRCVCTVIRETSVYHEKGRPSDCREREEAFRCLDEYLNTQGLTASGDIFCPYCLPSEQGFVVPFCQPVEVPEGERDAQEPTGLRGRLQGLFKRRS